MTEIYESVVLGGDERNVEYLGVFVAWLVCNSLLSVVLERSYERSIARVRMHEMTGPEFLTTVLDGVLRADHLSDEGRGFAEPFLHEGKYREIYDECTYEGEDEWARYAELAPRITSAFRHWRDPVKFTGKIAKVIQFPGPKR